ncbi:MAG: encapsulin-associated ferritin-like protein [Candidatus Rokuibacteriota bacterium]
MPQGSTTFHEAEERLKPATRDMHRAIVSLMEELEAIDWYQQRIDATEDAELRDILAHNRDEEQEHAAMVLEWIRRRSPGFDTNLKMYLFTEGSIAAREDVREGGHEPAANGTAAASVAPGTTIGSLRRTR